jgi:hypothetical protein
MELSAKALTVASPSPEGSGFDDPSTALATVLIVARDLGAETVGVRPSAIAVAIEEAIITGDDRLLSLFGRAPRRRRVYSAIGELVETGQLVDTPSGVRVGFA